MKNNDYKAIAKKAVEMANKECGIIITYPYMDMMIVATNVFIACVPTAIYKADFMDADKQGRYDNIFKEMDINKGRCYRNATGFSDYECFPFKEMLDTFFFEEAEEEKQDTEVKRTTVTISTADKDFNVFKCKKTLWAINKEYIDMVDKTPMSTWGIFTNKKVSNKKPICFKSYNKYHDLHHTYAGILILPCNANVRDLLTMVLE